MSPPLADGADPETLRHAARQTGAVVTDIDRGVLAVSQARATFTAEAQCALVGPAGARLLTAVDDLSTRFVTARTAFEGVADALHRIAAPIEDEQRTRRELTRAQRRLDDARRRLAAQRTVPGHVPVDRAALREAERDVEEAERVVRRATDRHERAEQARRLAVGQFVRACDLAASLAAIGGVAAIGGGPDTGGGSVTGAATVGPRFEDELAGDGLPRRGRPRTFGTGLTDSERRRLARNGLSPRAPQVSALYGSKKWQDSLVNQAARWPGGKGSISVGYGEASTEGGIGALGAGRYGISASLKAEAYALQAQAEERLKAGPVGATGTATVRAGGAEVSGDLDAHVGLDQARVRLDAGAFAGAKAGLDIGADVMGVKPKAGIEAQAGAGGSLGADAEFHGGRFRFQASAGLALGLGLKIKVGGEVDVREVVREPVHVAKSLVNAVF